MADTSFTDNLITSANRIVAAWLNVINNFVYHGKNPSYVTSTGSGTAYIITLSSSLLAALEAGEAFEWSPNATSTSTTPTLTVVGASSLAAVTIVGPGGGALNVGDIASGTVVRTVYNGTNFVLMNPATFLSTTGGTVTGDITMSGSMIKWAKGADVGSATALPLITDGNYFDVTGTTTITSFNTVGVGTLIGLHFDGALTLTHNATDLILPGGADIITAAGDEAIFIEYASGDYRCLSYFKAATGAVSTKIVLGTEQASTSGTSIDFTGIPARTRRINVMLVGVSLNTQDGLLVQIGDSGGIETSSYVSSTASITGSAAGGPTASTAGYIISAAVPAANLHTGVVTLLLEDSTDFTWAATGTLHDDRPAMFMFAGSKALSAELDRVRVTTLTGTSVFDAGVINISYEQ